jgi:hypothetical protein
MNNRAVDDSTGPTGMGFEFLRLANSIPVKRMFVRDAYQAWYQRGLPGTEETLLGAQARSNAKSMIAVKRARYLRAAGSAVGSVSAASTRGRSASVTSTCRGFEPS